MRSPVEPTGTASAGSPTATNGPRRPRDGFCGVRGGVRTERPRTWKTWIETNLTKGDHPIYISMYFLLIVFFAFF
ncbi:hypothetical protein, partial [Streptomyces sp. NPDC052127]|uniref:hypothetical protein n=1 Tax=Streptomyces sp. NPDC052127 TaxID=3155679 RepID=UPI00344A8DF6